MWAVQFCPPAPLGNTGLVSSGHKSFFCFFILPLPTSGDWSSPECVPCAYLSCLYSPALHPEGLTPEPFFVSAAERAWGNVPETRTRLPPHLFTCRVLAIFRATALCFGRDPKKAPPDPAARCEGRIGYGGHGLPLSSAPLPVFRHTKRPHGHIRRTASPRVSDARGMEEDAPPRKQTAAGRGKGTEERFRSLREGQALPFSTAPLRPQQTPPTVSACWSCSSRTASCAASNLRRLSSKSRM